MEPIVQETPWYSGRFCTKKIRKMFEKLGSGLLALLRSADKALILANMTRMAVLLDCIKPTCKINNPVILLIINPDLAYVMAFMAFLYVFYVFMWTIFKKIWDDDDDVNEEDMAWHEVTNYAKRACYLGAALFLVMMHGIPGEVNKLFCSLGINQFAKVFRAHEKHIQNRDNRDNNVTIDIIRFRLNQGRY